MNPTFESIRLAIERRLATWDGVPVEYDGAKTPQYDDKNPDAPQNKLPLVKAIWEKTPWIRCSIQHGASLTAGIGAGPCTRRTGLIMIQIFTPENQGSRPAALLADSLAAHFEYYQDGQFETQAASVQRIGESDAWYQYNVTLPFKAG